MKKLSKVFMIGLLSTMLFGMMAYAATPSEIYSELTGVTEEEAIQQRQEGKTYGNGNGNGSCGGNRGNSYRKGRQGRLGRK